MLTTPTQIDCRGPFDYSRSEGFDHLPHAALWKARSVLVKRGCVFYGYERDYKSGRVFVVDAFKKEGDVADVSTVFGVFLNLVL